MRGTTYAISEIVWWMLAGLAIGILIGWLLRRWYSGAARLKDVRAELDAKNARYAELSSELGDWKQKSEGLSRDLEARAGELTAATDRAGELEAQVSDLQSEKDAVTAEKDLTAAGAESAAAERDAKLAELESTVAERDSRLVELESTVADLRAELRTASADLLEARTAHAESATTAEASAGRLAGLETAIAEREERIEDLEATLAAAATPVADDMAAHSAALTHSADLEGLAAVEEVTEATTQLQLTRFGTAGADHTDDLKVINGIGPKMEELLNGFGIRAWDQLAALSPAEVGKVDEALEEFPGRIQRDRWVEQAIDLIRRFPDPANRPDRQTYLDEAPS